MVFCVYADDPYCAAVGFSDGVTSANIVGYNTIPVPADKLYITAVQFTTTSGLSELAIPSLLSVDVPKGAADIADAADQIWVWSMAQFNWIKYYYKSSRGTTVGWVRDGGDETKETTDVVHNGDAVFFRRSSAAAGNITLSGAIKTGNADPVSLSADQLHFICNPWPVSIKVKSFTAMIDTPKGAGDIADAADQIWLWDVQAFNWVKYYYKSSRGNTVGWVRDGGDESTETEDSIDVGKGFFFRRSSAANGTLTFVKPEGI